MSRSFIWASTFLCPGLPADFVVIATNDQTIILSVAIKNLKILVRISSVVDLTILRHSLSNTTDNGIGTEEVQDLPQQRASAVALARRLTPVQPDLKAKYT
jgi:hypothetical protein